MLTALSDEAGKFHNAIGVQAETIEDRDMATQQRIDLGNHLYTLTAELASIGKSLFEDTDEVWYNDYVLYDGHTNPESSVIPTA